MIVNEVDARVRLAPPKPVVYMSLCPGLTLACQLSCNSCSRLTSLVKREQELHES